MTKRSTPEKRAARMGLAGEILDHAGLNHCRDRYLRAAARIAAYPDAESSALHDAVKGVPGSAEALSAMHRGRWSPAGRTERRQLKRLLDVLRLARPGGGRLLSAMRIDFVAALVLIAAVWGAASAVQSGYAEFATPPRRTTQPNYLGFFGPRSEGLGQLIYHAELGKNLKVSPGRKDNPLVRVKLTNFRLTDQWRRVVSWAAHAYGFGKIEVTFPQNSATAIALFLTDGDSYWRMSKVRSGNTLQLADRLYNGRWLVFPITAEERRAGRKSFQLEQLTGESIAVSAVAVFNKNAARSARP